VLNVAWTIDTIACLELQGDRYGTIVAWTM
jgi:hypothetical protein